MKTIIIFATVTLFYICEAKVFSKCSLARQLKTLNFPSNKIRDWVCLVKAESSYRTNAIGRVNRNGSRDYGLFQINDKYWCSHGRRGKDCNVRCESLLTNNISLAATCAKKIYSRHGFEAWYGWKKHCKGRNMPSISECGI